MIDLTQETTDDFCEAFSGPDEDFCGAFARMVATGILPEGVDGDDARVKEIVRKCQDAASPAA
jgi:hypothetical protein